MESQTEPSHPWAHSNTLPAKEDLKSQISPRNSHRAFRDGRHITLEKTHSPVKTTKALKIIRRVGPGSLAGIPWRSLINRICCVADAKERAPSGTSQHLSGAEPCRDAMLWHRVSDWALTLAMASAGERRATGNCALEGGFLGGTSGKSLCYLGGAQLFLDGLPHQSLFLTCFRLRTEKGLSKS